MILAADPLYTLSELLLENLQSIQNWTSVLVGASIIAHIFNIALTMGNPATQGGERTAVSGLLFAIFCLIACLSYSSWILPLETKLFKIAQGFTTFNKDPEYRKNFLQKLDKHDQKKSMNLLGSGTNGTDGNNGYGLPGTIDLNAVTFSKNLSEAERKQKILQDADIKDPTMVDRMAGFVMSMASAPAHIGTSMMMPLVRDFSQSLMYIFNLLLVGLLPLSILYSSFPGTRQNLGANFLLLFAINLWQVALFVVDTILSTINDPKSEGILVSLGLSFQFIYPWIFLGLYIGIPALLGIVWPNNTSAIATTLNAGTVMLFNSAKSAVTKAAGSM